MIKGMHGMFRSSKPDELRAFLRDKLGLPATDIGRGWLIFDVPEADLGVHPAVGSDSHLSGEHDISFYTDDVKAAVATLQKRGVKLEGPIEDQGYGLVTYFTMPGDVKVQLYEPRYLKKANPKAKASAKPNASAKPKATARVAKKRKPAKKGRRARNG
jgi:hypothetical protein